MAQGQTSPTIDNRGAATAAAQPSSTVQPRKPESTGWKVFRWFRWLLAFSIALTMVPLVGVTYLYEDRRVCETTTVRSSGGGTEAATTDCRTLSLTDLFPILGVVAFLLLPDVGKLKIGGFEFQRLTDKVEEQTRELRSLQQTVLKVTTSNVMSVNHGGEELFPFIAAFYEEQVARFDVLSAEFTNIDRDLLAGDEALPEKLASIDSAIQIREKGGRLRVSLMNAAADDMEQLLTAAKDAGDKADKSGKTPQSSDEMEAAYRGEAE